MPPNKRIIFVFIAVIIFSLGFISSSLFVQKKVVVPEKNILNLESSNQGQIKSFSTNQNQTSVQNIDQFLVKRVIDGDTIEIENGQKIRYIGIDTPETVHPDKPVQCFGREASLKNKELVEGKSVRLEKDVSETDKYGRLLLYVYLVNEKSEPSIFINDYLVRQGYAHSSSYPPDVKYQERFRQAEAEARQNNRGLWANCTDGTNQQSAVSSQSTSFESGSNGCTIKGNISSSGEKIYHLPGQRYYDKTQIDISRGENWFCSEDEAISAGFRKSKI